MLKNSLELILAVTLDVAVEEKSNDEGWLAVMALVVLEDAETL